MNAVAEGRYHYGMITPLLVVQAAESSARSAGFIVGAIVTYLCFLVPASWGIIKCASILRRPTTHKTCVWSLLLFSSLWVIATLGNAARQLLGVESPIAKGLVSLLTAATVFASIIVAIVGLATYDRSKYTQGRAQAIWALVLNGVLVLGGVAIAAIGIAAKVREEQRLGGLPPDGKIELAELNFCIAPPPGWLRLPKPEAVVPAACIALRRPRPEIWCVVIGEQIGGGVERDAYIELIAQNIASASKVREQTQGDVAIDGRTFHRRVTLGRPNGTLVDLAYEHWIAFENGFVWQIVCWTKESHRSDLATAARELVGTFRMLDAGRVAGDSLEDVENPALGFSTRLAGLGWQKGEIDPDRPLALFKAGRLLEHLEVSALRFERDPPDLPALAYGLLLLCNFDAPNADEPHHSWRPAFGEGIELHRERTDDSDRTWDFRLRVVRGQRAAWLLAGWGLRGRCAMELLERSLDSIHFSEPVGDPPRLSAAALVELGNFLNRAGISYYQRQDFASAAQWFELAFAQARSDGVILKNLGRTYEESNRTAEGVRALAPHAADFAGDFAFVEQYSRLLALTGDPAGGNEAFRNIMDKGFQDEEVVLAWLDLLSGMEQHALALAAGQAWAAKHTGAPVRLRVARALQSLGDHPGALTCLEGLAADFPTDEHVMGELADLYAGTGEHLKAAQLAEKFLASGVESTRALMVLGDSQMERRWYREAKATYERASARDPASDEIRNALRRASAALGQGANSDVKTPIDPVPLPAELVEAMRAGTLPDGFGDGHPAVWLRRTTGFSFEPGKPRRRTDRATVKLLTTKGAVQFSTIEFRFDPVGERIFVDRLEVADAGGRRIASAAIEDAYVVDSDDAQASDEKILHLQVPSLQSGHTVEWEVTREDLGASREFAFERFLFARVLPAAAEAVYVAGDVSGLRSVTAQAETIRTLDSETLRAWVVPTRIEGARESYAPWREKFSPILWLGWNDADWETLARQYLADIADRLQPEESAKQLALGATEGLEEPRAKFAKLARLVQKDTAYTAIEFGVRGRRPNSAAQTIQLRYGDCKDHALLLHQLLRAVEIDSHLALVSTGWHIQPATPSLDPFDHMVVHVPLLGEGWLVDATDKHLDLAGFHADGIWHSHALVLDPAGPRLIEPAGKPAAGSSTVESRRSVTPNGGAWRVEETFTLHGYYASWMRGVFDDLDEAERIAKAQELLAEQGSARVDRCRVEGLADNSQPLRLVLDYQVDDAIEATGNLRSGALPALWERDYLELEFMKERRSPVSWQYPFRFVSEVEVHLPAAPTEESIAAMRQQASSRFTSWKQEPLLLAAEPGKPALALRFEFQAIPGEHPAHDYAAFYEAWESARRAWSRKLSWPSE